MNNAKQTENKQDWMTVSEYVSRSGVRADVIHSLIAKGLLQWQWVKGTGPAPFTRWHYLVKDLPFVE